MPSACCSPIFFLMPPRRRCIAEEEIYSCTPEERNLGAFVTSQSFKSPCPGGFHGRLGYCHVWIAVWSFSCRLLCLTSLVSPAAASSGVVTCQMWKNIQAVRKAIAKHFFSFLAFSLQFVKKVGPQCKPTQIQASVTICSVFLKYLNKLLEEAYLQFPQMCPLVLHMDNSSTLFCFPQTLIIVWSDVILELFPGLW